MTLATYVDVALAVLLVTTVFYAVRLNTRLGMLRRDRGELTALISQFNAATAAAEAAMEGLRASADNSGVALQKTVEKARATVADLDFLVERGEQTANRLDTGIRMGRGVERAAVPVEPPDRAPSASIKTEMRGKPDLSERAALLKAIESME